MSWRNQKIFALVALAAAFLINSLPAPDDASRPSLIARVNATR